MNDTQIKTDEEWAAIQEMRDQLEMEELALHLWLNQPVDDVNTNRWRQS